MIRKKIGVILLTIIMSGSIANTTVLGISQSENKEVKNSRVSESNTKDANKIEKTNGIAPGGCIDLNRNKMNFIEFEEVTDEEIELDEGLKEWAYKNIGEKGQYVYRENDKYNYVLISNGMSNGSGHKMIIHGSEIKDNILYIDFEHYQTEAGKLTKNIDYPYIIIKINKALEFDKVSANEKANQIITIEGDFFNERTGEYHITGVVSEIKEDKFGIIVKIKRVGADMKVRIPKGTLSKSQIDSVKVRNNIDVYGKEGKDAAGNQSIIVSEMGPRTQKRPGDSNQESIKKSGVDFQLINKYDIKDEKVTEFIRNNERTKGDYVLKTEDAYYYLVAAGQRNSGGYSVRVKEVELKDGEFKVEYKINEPKPGSMVTMAITHPIALIKVSSNYEINSFKAEEIKIDEQKSEDLKVSEEKKTNEIDKTVEDKVDKKQDGIFNRIISWFVEMFK